jgi:hypothetical protein
MAAGGLAAIAGLAIDATRFAYAWLLAFMFFLSLGLGALFLVMAHHLFDASWSVPIRRLCEHVAAWLFPWLALMFLPVALLAPRIYRWMQAADPGADHALRAKWPLFTPLGFYLVALFCFGAWWVVSRQLRAWSLRQDQDGSAECTRQLRRWSAGGMFAFAPTLSLAAVMWMMALQHEWCSAIYGVYYFAESVWTAIALVYFAAIVLRRAGILAPVLGDRQFYFLGSLLLAFTVFYAYIHFSQYFVIWNANLPEETSWYVLRERGSWRYVGLAIIFGHFLLPFLALLRIDLKLKSWWMAPLCVWVWLMHYVELAFNIMPVQQPDGFCWRWVWLDFACLAFMAGLFIKLLARDFARHAPYPIRDPRLSEALAEGQLDTAATPAGQLSDRSDRSDRSDSSDRPGNLAQVAGVLAACLLLAALAWVAVRATRPPGLDQARADLRRRNLAELRATEKTALETYDWIDPFRGMVRLPIARAMELSITVWQDPQAGRSNLLSRLAKATAKIPEGQNPYE